MRQDNRRDGKRFGGRRNFSNHGFSGGHNSGDRTMYQAVCDACGQACEVPFKPTSGKPIYCDACFSKNKSRGDGGRSERRFDSRPSFGGNRSSENNQIKLQLDSINIKLDTILAFLKPVTKVKTSTKDKEVKTEEVKKPVKKATVKKVVKKPMKKTTKKPVKKLAKKK